MQETGANNRTSPQAKNHRAMLFITLVLCHRTRMQERNTLRFVCELMNVERLCGALL